jgi:paraquat-inducible protein B
MSKPANKTLIGTFVVGAIVLVVASLLVFGSGAFFKKTGKFVLYFDSSVKGLNVGAPVMFRGVKIGQVTSILLRFNPRDLSTIIPVYIEIDPGLLTIPEAERSLVEKAKKYQFMKGLIAKGLKAQLQMQSFVTGQLMINLDFYPEKPVKLAGVEKRYLEIPTVPTSLEQLTKTLQNLDLNELYKKFMNSMSGIDRIVNAPGASESLPAARDMLKQAQQTLAALQVTVQSNAKLGYDMNSMMKELNRTARSLRILSDYLERHPESLIRGKKN